jgi:DNA polymerase III epsilon subunit family exonuclease
VSQAAHPSPPTPSRAQLEAIEAGPGPVLVLAGPGAGKTFCLIERVRHLIVRRDYPPERICAVTFTNKAAGEIAERLERDLGDVGRHVTRGTLHTLAAQVLRQYPGEAGLRPGFGIADEEYQRTLLRRLRVPVERHGPLLNLFGRRRLQGYRLSPEDERLLAEYGSFLRRHNLVDFDELILYAHHLFKEHEPIRQEVAGRWDAVLVDEFQDLSHTQYAIIRQLAHDHRHVFAVGDDEQSIYGWTGADPRILDQFRRDFDIAKPIPLDENHRSARQIFEAARRILKANTPLFEKALTARRESPFPVVAVGFADEKAEATWLTADLARDRRRHNLRWGDFAVLYRQHLTGRPIEETLLQAGIPVRAARGRALTDDKVIAEVLGSLRILHAPHDPVAVDALARLVLDDSIIMRAEAEFGHEQGQLTALRLFARLRRGSEHERKSVMRFVFHVENLPGLKRTTSTLGELVDALLAQRPSRRRGVLEDRADELTDPAEVPGAPELAATLAGAAERGGHMHVRPGRGLEIALGGMLAAAGLAVTDAPGAGDIVLDPASRPGFPILLFKALQLHTAASVEAGLRDCVTFDLETTDDNADACGIVEIGAARVRDGRVVETFGRLVRPDRVIAAPATRVHGYTDADVAGAPPFAEVWPEFRAFVGRDVLVAHNGVGFDVPVLRRHVAALRQDFDRYQVFDTLPLARSLYRSGARLQDLARRFGVDMGRIHHAEDDARTLALVLRGLADAAAARARKTAFVQGLDWLGLALVLDPSPADLPDAALLREVTRFFTLGRYGEALDDYTERAAGRTDLLPAEEVLDRLGGRELRNRLRRERRPDQMYPSSVARLRALMDMVRATELDAAIAELLEIAALSSSREGVEADRNRVNLLTLHATKGLEFSRVYVVGVEDAQMPGYRAMRDKLEDEWPEARRVLYVGMTRARDRLVLTRVERRRARSSGGTTFLDELGLRAEPPAEAAARA